VNAVLFEKGDGATQFAGPGGIGGGDSFAEGGDSNVAAAKSNVLPVSVTGAQPPPST
jgi:hypothetical protein